jgi:hypothetical protein
MFDIWRKDTGQKLPPLTSPAEIAFRYTTNKTKSPDWKEVDYGSSVATLGLLFNEGGCPFYNGLDFNRDIQGDRKAEFRKLEELFNEYKELSKKRKKERKQLVFFLG